TRREMLISTLVGASVLGLIVYGILTMGGSQHKATTNTLTGTIRSKKFTPRPEDQIRVGAGGLRSSSTAGEYLLEVFVKAENRTFQVPVEFETYEAVRVGDSFTFIRPRSEQVN